MEVIEVKTGRREEIVDITSMVENSLNVEEGLALIYSPHTTTSIIINEAESGLLEDIISQIGKLVPYRAGYRHDRIDSNADAHIKASIFGNSAVVPVKNGRLVLGTWQRILFVEFDGPRNRKVFVKVI
ncbi:secondary thiamine-phosphate synthase enzyme YjbQ [Archaeoglobus neptunius]|uniref:secondary thiamine-phosphate synthase enzyme YjbQ n=1 Tax=Archaeoglobus neptunius TaxID=2798580 RepID=UPI001926A143|nr:secondary thiamine-phosphate synthase enzyme YjbQ [Archaeoglobus neptunius]